MTSAPRKTAFFDVDETLIDAKSMGEFLNFYHSHQGGVPTWEGFIAALPPGTSREATNRAYYGIWRGMPRSEIRAWGALWFRGASRQDGFYIKSTISRLSVLQASGYDVVLVSGSFDALLDPIAVELNASAILCSAPDQAGDRYLGTLQTPMIGENKAYAILEYCVRNGVDPADCIAFGDHESDLPMLEAVGGGFWVRTSGEIEQHRPSVRT